MFVPLEGNAEEQILDEEKSCRRIDVLTAGMNVGEMAFLNDSPRLVDVLAVDTVECLISTCAWFIALTLT
jgi:glutaminase